MSVSPTAMEMGSIIYVYFSIDIYIRVCVTVCVHIFINIYLDFIIAVFENYQTRKLKFIEMIEI